MPHELDRIVTDLQPDHGIVKGLKGWEQMYNIICEPAFGIFNALGIILQQPLSNEERTMAIL